MWDFPLVNIASARVVSGGKIERIRIVVNGVAAHPWRLTQVEEAVTGKPANEETAEMAGQMAIEGAVPLRYNAYKVAFDAQSRKARDSRWGSEGGGCLNFIQWAQSPWGERVPIHIVVGICSGWRQLPRWRS